MARIASGAELTRAQSLQFSMEFEDDHPPQSPAESMKMKLALQQLWRLMACSSPVEREMQHLVHDARDESAGGDGLTSAALAQVFEQQGYETCLRTALGGGNGVDCLHNLRHSFLLVRPPGSGIGEPSYIVDIEFKDQFRVAASTKHYQSLIENMEGEFIGSEQKLRAVLQMLCDEMVLAFAEKDIVLPPWRQLSSMLSKWCPRRSEDFMPDGRRISKEADANPSSAVLDLQRSNSYLKCATADKGMAMMLDEHHAAGAQGVVPSHAPALPWETRTLPR